MSIKDKLAALLRGQPSEKPPDKESAGTPAPEPEQAPESSGPGVLNQSLLELSAEHQIYRLYNQRRQEAGDSPQQGALPAAVGSQQNQHLSGPDGQAHVLQY